MAFFQRLKENHISLMLLTCVLPLVAVLIAVYYFGVGKGYLLWVGLGICMLSHLLMMKHMHGDSHKNGADTQNDTSETNKNETKQRGSCH